MPSVVSRSRIICRWSCQVLAPSGRRDTSMAAAVQAGRMTDSPGEDLGGGLAVDDYAGEVCVNGVCGCSGRAGVGDLLTVVF